MFRHLLALRQLSTRSISSTARRQVANKVAETQKLYQVDNGIPVHLKGGTVDALLYRFTMTLTILGTGGALYQLLSAALPRKN
ncbi:hypothetical protein AAFF_G00068810 [Aldrovandia affinis]|uniref:Cytochrome c oxidase subunit 7A2, mitochondrial n=1 Tax=Aldrovandia affinis TaxID=143900 RepID=A0AAD7RZB7_9TELE|nr:hypothetical protein AAFF_G00068810 [Aldrovandia affinis]